jgi:peptidoglycan/LPS O-acetylase OafA/YrhL
MRPQLRTIFVGLAFLIAVLMLIFSYVQLADTKNVPVTIGAFLTAAAFTLLGIYLINPEQVGKEFLRSNLLWGFLIILIGVFVITQVLYSGSSGNLLMDCVKGLQFVVGVVCLVVGIMVETHTTEVPIR